MTDVENEGTWLDRVNRNKTEELIWDSDAKYQNSEDRDYGVVFGSVFQAYAGNETGPDVLCSRSNVSWIEFVPV